MCLTWSWTSLLPGFPFMQVSLPRGRTLAFRVQPSTLAEKQESGTNTCVRFKSLMSQGKGKPFPNQHAWLVKQWKGWCSNTRVWMTGSWSWLPCSSGRVSVDMCPPQGEEVYPKGTSMAVLLQGFTVKNTPLPFSASFLSSPHSLYLISPNPVKHTGWW